MATRALVSVDEYLHTAYKPDCEFVDGEVIERNSGEIPHSHIQGLLYAYFLRRRKTWGVTPLLEVRTQMRANKFFVPDICVVRGPAADTRILNDPPLIWIEILSREDRPVRVHRKVRDVLEFGSEYVWVIDPESLESYVATPQAQYELSGGVFRIPEEGIEVPLLALDED